MSALELEPVDTDRGNDDLMVHVWDDERPGGPWGLCGTRLLGIDASTQELDCVVCAAEVERLGIEIIP